MQAKPICGTSRRALDDELRLAVGQCIREHLGNGR
jgi:hypothetical protein